MINMMRKSAMILLILVMASSLLWSVQPAEAAVITNIRLSTNTPYLIAGVKYAAYVKTDKASSTSIATSISYAPHTSNAWVHLGNNHHDGSVPITIIHLAVDVFDSDYDKYDVIIPFSIPLDPGLTSARIKVNSFFDPLIGSKSSSERILGPYDVKQPGDPENLVVVTHEDGTVTLSWDDLTNMEKYYEISRSGPDGVKLFYYEDATDYIGRLTFHDKTTDKSKDTLYLYKITPVIHEKYALPDHLRPGNISKLVKTTAPVNPLSSIKIIGSIDIKSNFQSSDNILNSKVFLEPSVQQSPVIRQDLDIYNKMIDRIGDINLDLENVDRVTVKSVSLDQAELTLKEGDSASLKATISPSTAVNQNVIWKSDNPSVAAVDNNGKVQAVSEGTATIKVQTEDGGLSATCVVTVMPAIQFSDITEHWAKDEITEAVKLGIVNGYPDGTFRPEANVTRAEFIVMLMRGLQSKIPGSPLQFTDQGDIGGWAAEYVKQAVSQEIIFGYPDGTFRPQANITHAEMITMVIRASGLDPNPSGETSYADHFEIPAWARPTVATAQMKGIVFGGIANNQFKPLANATRAEAVSSIVKLLRMLNTQG